jgi:hypothetical protein
LRRRRSTLPRERETKINATPRLHNSFDVDFWSNIFFRFYSIQVIFINQNQWIVQLMTEIENKNKKYQLLLPTTRVGYANNNINRNWIDYLLFLCLIV